MQKYLQQNLATSPPIQTIFMVTTLKKLTKQTSTVALPFLKTISQRMAV